MFAFQKKNRGRHAAPTKRARSGFFTKQKFLSFALCATLVGVCIPQIGYAAASEYLYVNGVDILKESSHVVSCGGGTAYFDETTNTLTLTNAEITTGFGRAGYYSAITAYSSNILGFDGVVNIECRGSNRINLIKPTSGADATKTLVGVYSGSRLQQGLAFNIRDNASLSIAYQGVGENENVVGILAEQGGVTVYGENNSNLSIDNAETSTADGAVGIMSSATLNIKGINANITGFGTGIQSFSRNYDYRQTLLGNNSTVNIKPSAYEHSTGISLSNGSTLEVDSATLNITRGANAIKKGISAERNSLIDDPYYVRFRNGAVVNIDCVEDGVGVQARNCDVSVDASNVTISTATSGSKGYGIYAFEAEAQRVKERRIDINGSTFKTTTSGSSLYTTGTINVTGGNTTAKSTSESVFYSDDINLTGLESANLEGQKSALHANNKITIQNANNLEMKGTSATDDAVSATNAISFSGAKGVSVTSASNGIVSKQSTTTVDSCETFKITAEKSGISQSTGEIAIKNTKGFEVVAKEHALYNIAGDVSLKNSISVLKSSANVVDVTNNVNILGGSTDLTNEAKDSTRGAGIYSKEGKISLTDGARSVIQGYSGGIVAEKGDIQITNSTPTTEDDFPVAVTSKRNDGDGDNASDPALQAKEGGIKVVASRISASGENSTYAIYSKSGVTTDQAGIIYATGGQYGIFTEGMFAMKNIADEVKTSGSVAGIVSKIPHSADASDPNGFNIAAGLIDFNEHLPLNVKNTDWLEDDAGAKYSLTTVMKQDVESVDKDLTDNDNNAWIKAGEYYVITYKLAGGEWPLVDPSDPTSERKNPNVEVYRATDSDITLKAPERDGYTFRGWTGTDLSEVTDDVVIKPTQGQIGQREYTAVWSVGGDQSLVYTTSSVDRGSVTNSGETPLVSEKTAKGSTAVANAGYHFVNWSKVTLTQEKQESGDDPSTPDTPDQPDTPDSPDTPDQPDNPDVDNPDAGDNNNNTNIVGAEAEATDSTGSTTEQSNLNQQVVSEEAKLVPTREDGKAWEATVYFANFEGNKYTVSFNSNGGIGSMKDQAFTFGQKSALNKTTFKRDGYVFSGWSTSKGSSSPEFADGTDVINLTDKDNGNVVLYAVWTKPYKGEPGSDNGGNGKEIIKYVKSPGAYGAGGWGYYDANGNWIPMTGDSLPGWAVLLVVAILVASGVATIVAKKNKQHPKVTKR